MKMTRVIALQVTVIEDIEKEEDRIISPVMQHNMEFTYRELLGVDDVVITDIQDFLHDAE